MIGLWLSSLLSILIAALVMPFFGVQRKRLMMWFGCGVLTYALIAHAFTTMFVLREGAFTYQFGGHEATLGVSFLIDPLALLINGMILLLSWLIFFYGWANTKMDFEKAETHRYVALTFILVFSMMSMVYTNDLFNTYVFMEIMSITTCAIISVKRKKENYAAAFRYLMLNEIGSLSYLLGLGFVYVLTGHLNIDAAASGMRVAFATHSTAAVMGLSLMVLGLMIKAAIFPLHVWLPDAHASAPSTSSAMLSAIVVKVYLVVLYKVLYRVFGFTALYAIRFDWVLLTLAMLGMVMGSLFAMAQKDVKRMLGYSSVSQVGYILLGLSLGTPLGVSAALFHIVSHALLKSALFLSVGSFIAQYGKRRVRSLRGLGLQMPISTTVFSIAALGMIGIPITSGFLAKWALGLALADVAPWVILVVLGSSVLNAMYYLPILIDFYLKPNDEKQVTLTIDRVPKRMLVVLGVFALLIVGLGLYPVWLNLWIERALTFFSVGGLS